jgi:hypothetical protein
LVNDKIAKFKNQFLASTSRLSAPYYTESRAPQQDIESRIKVYDSKAKKTSSVAEKPLALSSECEKRESESPFERKSQA